MTNQYTLKLTSIKNINEHTVHFEFSIQEQQKLELIAGQFLRLLFVQNGQEVFRSYSVANILKSNSDSIEGIELAVSWVDGGLATEYLSAMNIGDCIQASAPYGRFCLTDKKWQRYFLVATGTGITPYRAMTNELMQRIKTDGSEVFVIMGARDESGLLYNNEFRNYAKTDSYHYISCLSRSELSEPTDLDLKGHVQTYLQQLDFDSETDIAYLCGNPAMVDEVFSLLKDKGLPVVQIRREKYVSPPIRKIKPIFNIRN